MNGAVAGGVVVKRQAVFCVGLVLLGTSCTKTVAIQPPPPPKPSSTFVAWSQTGLAAKRVCVLPFSNLTRAEGFGDRLRESFWGRLSLKRFTDIELRELDAQLNALPQPWNKITPQQLGQVLHCDALLYGEVLDASNIYIGVYAQLTVEGKIQLVDAATGQTLVIGSHATTFRVGSVPFSLLEVVPEALLNLRNLSSEQSLRAVDDLARNLADMIPDLPFPDSLNLAAPAASRPSDEAERSKTTLNDPALTTVTRTDVSQYRVQIGSFTNPGEAQQTAQRLRKEGFQPMVVDAVQDDRSWHKVVLGPFSSFNAAQKTGEQVQQRLRLSPMIVRLAAP
jgi:hypothetical protein